MMMPETAPAVPPGGGNGGYYSPRSGKCNKKTRVLTIGDRRLLDTEDILSLENAPQIPLNPPLLEGNFMIPLFGKEGLGEIFIVLCDGRPSWAFHRKMRIQLT